MEYINQLRGARSKQTGQAFENIISDACRYYSAVGTAEIYKTPEPFRVERHVNGGKFIGHYEKAAQPDFKGVLRGGRAVLFEAKYTDSDRIKQDAVTEAQNEAFKRHAKLGARCFVLVSFGFRRYYRIPWDVWERMRQLFGHRFMTTEDAAQYEIHTRNGILHFLDFMIE